MYHEKGNGIVPGYLLIIFRALNYYPFLLSLFRIQLFCRANRIQRWRSSFFFNVFFYYYRYWNNFSKLRVCESFGKFFDYPASVKIIVELCCFSVFVFYSIKNNLFKFIKILNNRSSDFLIVCINIHLMWSVYRLVERNRKKKKKTFSSWQ